MVKSYKKILLIPLIILSCMLFFCHHFLFSPKIVAYIKLSKHLLTHVNDSLKVYIYLNNPTDKPIIIKTIHLQSYANQKLFLNVTIDKKVAKKYRILWNEIVPPFKKKLILTHNWTYIANEPIGDYTIKYTIITENGLKVFAESKFSVNLTH